jgi:hypothetical protein
VSLLVLSQPSLGIELQIQSQGTPVPAAAVAAARAATPADYEHAQTGYSVTIGSIMSASLQVSSFFLFLKSPSTGLAIVNSQNSINLGMFIHRDF